jgi:6-pyruvoyltetrahydropterin/6-carboxytetrahydropterin synthase
MITCLRRIQFCAGHRVHEHESKCRNLHGHNYVAFFEACGIDADLDRLGRVIDFAVLKERIGGWIDQHWDHGFILWTNDQEAIVAVSGMLAKKLYLMPTNPTAENMAKHLLRDVCPTLMEGSGVKVIKVTIWETENCIAVAEE